MSPAVEQIRKTVEERIRELRPVIDELEQLQGILSLLEGEEVTRGTAPDSLTALLARAGIDADATSRQPIRRSRRGTKPGRDGRAPQGANKQRIIEAVMQDPGVTATEISERTGVKRTVVSATINRLKRNGELEPLGQGVRVPSGRRLAALAQ
jgi:predicted HTH transcriptional regulator